MRKFAIILVGLAAAAIVIWMILPPTSTGDEAIDAVVRLVDPFGDCVTVRGQSDISLPSADPHAPPGQVTPDRFKNPAIRHAASAIAKRQGSLSREAAAIRHFGKRDADRCGMRISRPVHSGEFAFVEFSSPSGEIGVIVLKKSLLGGWGRVEHVRMGYW